MFEKFYHWFYYTRFGLIAGLAVFALFGVPIILLSLVCEGWKVTSHALAELPKKTKEEWRRRAFAS